MNSNCHTHLVYFWCVHSHTSWGELIATWLVSWVFSWIGITFNGEVQVREFDSHQCIGNVIFPCVCMCVYVYVCVYMCVCVCMWQSRCITDEWCSLADWTCCWYPSFSCGLRGLYSIIAFMFQHKVKQSSLCLCWHYVHTPLRHR